MRHLVKVPAAMFVAGLVAAGCGGDAESAADLESERLEALIEAEVEARVEERIDSMRESEAVQPRPAEERAQAPSSSPPAGGTGSGSASPPAGTAAPPPAAAEPERVEEAPAPTPTFEPEPIAIAAGTEIRTVVEADISTRTHEAGNTFRTHVADDVLAADGLVLVPAGAFVEGRVVEARRSTGPDEEAVLELAFEHIVVNGERIAMRATLAEAELESQAGDSGARTAAKVATGAAAGAVIGRILGRDTRSTVQGAAAGAVAGAGIALTTRDGHAIIREGSTLVVRIDQPVIIASGR